MAENAEDAEPVEEPPAPIEVERGRIFGVRMNYEKLSFGAAWHSDTGAELDFDFACLMFAENGDLKDAVYYGSMSSKGGAVRHMGDDKSGFGAADEDDEVINVMLAKVPPEITTIVFIVCASPEEMNPVTLATPDILSCSLYGYGPNIGDEHEVVIRGGINLKDWLKEDSDSCLMQTLALHRTLNGWNVHCLLTEHEGITWGDIIPDVKLAIKDLPMMKMDDVEIDIFERISIARKFEDSVLDDLANASAIGAPVTDEVRKVRKVRVDLGWRLEEHQEAKVDLDLGAIFYNPSGEETGRISYKSKEIQGAELTGDDRRGNAADYGMDKGFVVNESIIIDFEEIPDETKSIVFCVSNYTETGFATLEACHCRFVDITNEEDEKDLVIFTIETDLEKKPTPPKVEGEEAPAEPAEGEEAPAEPEPEGPRPLDETMAQSTALILAKLYKEFKDSAYWGWRRSGHKDLASMVGDGNLKGAMTFAKSLKSSVDYEKHLEETANMDDEIAEEAAASGEDVDAALAKAEEESPFQWRFRSLGIYCQGATLDDTANDMTNAGLYEGKYDPQGRRHDKRAKCTFPNGDSFFGEYYRDRRQGLGIYVCKNGAIYCGYFMNSLRHGAGLMSFPNGDVYQGEYKRDLPDGKGVYFYADGTIYAGMYKEGKKHGEGVIKYKGGSLLQGMWYKGQQEGPSKFDAEGYTFEGAFTQDCPDKSGTFSIDLNMGKPAYPSCRAFIHKDVTLTATGGAYEGAPPRPPSPEPVPEGEEPPPPPAEEDLPVVPSAEKGWGGLAYGAGGRDAMANGEKLVRPPPPYTGAHERFLATVLHGGDAPPEATA